VLAANPPREAPVTGHGGGRRVRAARHPRFARRCGTGRRRPARMARAVRRLWA